MIDKGIETLLRARVLAGKAAKQAAACEQRMIDQGIKTFLKTTAAAGEAAKQAAAQPVHC